MNVLFDHFSAFRDGFIGTLEITVISTVIACVLGIVIAGFRVSPVPPLRFFGTAWVTILRNTPLTLLFLVATFVVPEIFFPGMSPFLLASLALGFYTSSFICEAIRSGIGTVPLGQAGRPARSV